MHPMKSINFPYFVSISHESITWLYALFLYDEVLYEFIFVYIETFTPYQQFSILFTFKCRDSKFQGLSVESQIVKCWVMQLKINEFWTGFFYALRDKFCKFYVFTNRLTWINSFVTAWLGYKELFSTLR